MHPPGRLDHKISDNGTLLNLRPNRLTKIERVLDRYKYEYLEVDRDVIPLPQ